MSNTGKCWVEQGGDSCYVHMVITHVNTILKIELAEYCQVFLGLPIGIKERHRFGQVPAILFCAPVNSVQENACRKWVINLCVYLHEKVVRRVGWDSIQHSSRTGFLKPLARDLHLCLNAAGAAEM